MLLSQCNHMESKSIRNNIFNLKKDITNICIGCKRNPKDIRIVAASKTKSIKEISLAYKSGISNFGENYLQEAIPKIEGLEKKDINWHFIGSIQKKKCKKIALLFDWVHTIDRVEIAEKLNEYRKILPNKLNILIQININEEKSKAAVDDLKQRGGSAFAVKADVSDYDAVENAINGIAERAGRIDILVNNAGTNVRKRPEALTPEDWHTVMDANISSAFFCSKI